MKRKVIVIAGVLLAAIIAITVFMRMMGGSGVGIDNDPEAEVKGDSNVLVAYFSWSGNGQQMAGWISEAVNCSELSRLRAMARILIPVLIVRKMNWIMRYARNCLNT